VHVGYGCVSLALGSASMALTVLPRAAQLAAPAGRHARPRRVGHVFAVERLVFARAAAGARGRGRRRGGRSQPLAAALDLHAAVAEPPGVSGVITQFKQLQVLQSSQRSWYYCGRRSYGGTFPIWRGPKGPRQGAKGSCGTPGTH
jgi:hypothetical protein